MNKSQTDEIEIKYLRKLKLEYENQIHQLKGDLGVLGGTGVSSQKTVENTEKELIREIANIREYNDYLEEQSALLEEELKEEGKWLGEQNRMNFNLKIVQQNSSLGVDLQSRPVSERIKEVNERIDGELGPLLAKVLQLKTLNAKIVTLKYMVKRKLSASHHVEHGQTLILAYALQFLMNSYIKNPEVYVSANDILAHFQFEYPDIHRLVDKEANLSIEFSLLEKAHLIEKRNNEPLYRLIQVYTQKEHKTIEKDIERRTARSSTQQPL